MRQLRKPHRDTTIGEAVFYNFILVAALSFLVVAFIN